MKLSPYAIKMLSSIVNGDAFPPYRKGSELVDLFNKYGCRDLYDEKGLPDIGKANGQRPSRTQYVQNRLTLFLDKPELREILNDVLTETENPELLAVELNEILNPESYSVVERNREYKVEGGVINNKKPAISDAHFKNIQDQVLTALDSAKVSIHVAMAWFTNDVIRDKLIERQNDGVDVYIAIFNDGINGKHGVDLSAIPHKLIRGSRGGLMHNKFCIIDNQKVVTGSYNWSTNAETRNDENVTIFDDPEQATKFTLEFRRLIK